ncbi:MAG: hypothetical protein BGN96_04890 [Bacteroidales bacterium 45-6]|uniref:hypothetical protein n=1 Tax=uncultured Dysgonomonas sp. TaxID=206096 RepID=UPI0009601A34|nr:hypothetical protein [uncultured Dysgonomonas sp.]OJU35474.1 MAG: hypothetical protein BGN96_04890 [Bacteroidales bacterium 45-6]
MRNLNLEKTTVEESNLKQQNQMTEVIINENEPMSVKIEEMSANVNVKSESTSTVEDTSLQATSGASLAELRIDKMRLKDFLDKGHKFAFLQENNRDVNKSHVAKLKESIERDGRILRPIEVIPIEQAFAEGLKVFTSKDVELKADTDEAKDRYVVIDGQHRIYASLKYMQEHKDSSVDVSIEQISIPKSMDICGYIAEINFNVKAWDAKAIRKAAVKKNEDNGNTILPYVDKYSKELKMPERAIFKSFFLCDKYRKTLYEKAVLEGLIVDDLKPTKEQIARAEKIIKAFQVGFANHGKLMRNSAAIDCFMKVYNNANDDDKANCVESLLVFFSTLPKETLDKTMEEETVADKTRYFEQEFHVFQEKWVEEKDTLLDEMKKAHESFGKKEEETKMQIEKELAEKKEKAKLLKKNTGFKQVKENLC